MSSEKTTLHLIDAIPKTREHCYPGSRQLICRLSSGGESIRRTAEDVALWQGTAEAVEEGRTSFGWAAQGENGQEIYPTSDQREAGSCLMKRVLGLCPIYEVDHE